MRKTIILFASGHKEHEIEIEILGVDRDSFSIPEYKQKMRKKETAEAEKRVESKTKVMNQIISAGKPVEKEIKEIKAKVSTVSNLFGGEQMVKMPKSTFDKMLLNIASQESLKI